MAPPKTGLVQNGTNQSNPKTRSLKRKSHAGDELSSRKKKRVKIQDARVISAQTKGQAFSNGHVNVDKFVEAREYEIRALEAGAKKSRKGLSARAFQNVPRELRRRTASHNVKRVPKRLQRRAAKEMAEDNTPTVTSKTKNPGNHMRLRLDTIRRLKQLRARRKEKDEPPNKASSSNKRSKEPRIAKNSLRKPARPKAKFRKRQIHKSWLPTHVWHAKRAHMTPPKQPLWRMAIPLSPTAKSYRPTHRASSARGSIAWDMSYMSTIGLEGPENSIKGLLTALGVGMDEGAAFWDVNNSKWIRGTRSWHGWSFERDSRPLKAIAPVTVFWCCTADINADEDTTKSNRKNVRRAFVRVHPSAFHQLWEEIAKLCKIQKPVVAAIDLRFDIGSIDLVGPSSAEALTGALWPVQEQQSSGTVEVWSLLRHVPNPANLPSNAIISMNVQDPRLHYPPRKFKIDSNCETQEKLLKVLAEWPLDFNGPSPALFDPKARYEACRQLPSQKAINRRKAKSPPGEYPEPKDTDPKIPVLLLVTRGGRGNQGTWTLLLPWKCVLPVWSCLLHYPLSAGGTMRFGGLSQRRQVFFESGIPWFPGDFPGTKAGATWEIQERAEKKALWERKPKGKRVEWDSVDLGHDRKGEVGIGWACDWSRLVLDPSKAEFDQLCHIRFSTALRVLKSTAGEGEDDISQNGVAAVRVTLLGRGAPMAAARLYRLPLIDTKLRNSWLSLQSNKRPEKQPPVVKVPKDAPAHVRRQHLAASLLAPEPASGSDAEHPKVPAEEDLIGFVTTGNFNLAEGKGTALGSLMLRKALESRQHASEDLQSKHERLCIVRDAGQRQGRLALWELA